ncbi:MAG TPA: hypothetical protein VEZ90_17630 [Blastocatellia bacterium]|nr:hypothetical protein [Blastocatellia bacterium]
MRSLVAIGLSMLMLCAMAPFMRAQAQDRYLEPGSQMLISLETRLDSRSNRPGDTFVARVEEPERLEGAEIDGHVANIEPSGRFRGRTEMQLAFDSIRFPDGNTAPFDATVMDVRQSESVKMVDENGDIVSGRRSDQAIKRGTIGAIAGGLLGAILGGGRGAAIGLVSGGAAGAGSLVFDHGKRLQLETGTEMDIETLRVRDRDRYYR